MKNLYRLFEGDIQTVEWFYNNRTYADYYLIIGIKNERIKEQEEAIKRK